jgi:hypothetical protein
VLEYQLRVNFYKTRSEHNVSAIPPKLSVKADVADCQKLILPCVHQKDRVPRGPAATQ